MRFPLTSSFARTGAGYLGAICLSSVNSGGLDNQLGNFPMASAI